MFDKRREKNTMNTQLNVQPALNDLVLQQCAIKPIVGPGDLPVTGGK